MSQMPFFGSLLLPFSVNCLPYILCCLAISFITIGGGKKNTSRTLFIFFSGLLIKFTQLLWCQWKNGLKLALQSDAGWVPKGYRLLWADRLKADRVQSQNVHIRLLTSEGTTENKSEKPLCGRDELCSSATCEFTSSVTSQTILSHKELFHECCSCRIGGILKNPANWLLLQLKGLNFSL